jgi:hypothetical protein
MEAASRGLFEDIIPALTRQTGKEKNRNNLHSSEVLHYGLTGYSTAGHSGRAV